MLGFLGTSRQSGVWFPSAVVPKEHVVAAAVVDAFEWFEIAAVLAFDAGDLLDDVHPANGTMARPQQVGGGMPADGAAGAINRHSICLHADKMTFKLWRSGRSVPAQSFQLDIMYPRHGLEKIELGRHTETDCLGRAFTRL